MDEVERLLQLFKLRASAPALSRLDVLMDLERLPDPRIVPFLLDVLIDRHQPSEVRISVLKRLRKGPLASNERSTVARAIGDVLFDGSCQNLRLHAALALAEFTDVASVLEALGGLALDPTESLELRYSAFTSLERARATPGCVELLRQLAADETLGRAAGSLLSTWQLE